MKRGDNMKKIKNISEQSSSVALLKSIRMTCDCLSRPITLDRQLFLSIVTRPISVRALLPLPVLLWLFWPQIHDFLAQHFPAIFRYNTLQLEFVVCATAAASIIALVAPFIRANTVFVELGLSKPANADVVE